MSVLPEKVSKAWDERKGPVIFTTVGEDGVPNTIYVTCVKKLDEGAIVIADNYFQKTQENILAGSKGSLLYITDEGKAYQLKGSIEYLKDGDIFEDMKTWNPKKHPGHAATVLRVEQVFSGSEKLG